MNNTIEQMPENGVQIIQATPGRIQVRVPQLADDAQLAQQLEQFALHTGGITSILINRAAASFVITYKADAATNAKIRSCIESLIESDRQTASPPVQLPLPEAEGELAARQQSEVQDLQQQLENLQQSMAAQTEKYEALQQKYQQQTELVSSLQQQLAERHSSPQIQEDTNLAQQPEKASRWKWRRKFFG